MNRYGHYDGTANIGKAAKLEKADILEMTVDFVKRTQIKVLKVCVYNIVTVSVYCMRILHSINII